ncbi:MAG: hypothetical protein U0736_09020 [Gemmataceae bacterium]
MVLSLLFARPEVVDGNATIAARVGDSKVVITTTARLAGAIHSLTWRGREFIDSTDHGRQLQSASNFDCGKPLIAETYNPTEAGSRRDGAGPTSTGRLLALRGRGNELTTRNQMAFWLRPGEKSEGHPAYNTTALSNHLLTKRVRIGFKELDNVLDYRVTFTVPEGEHHTWAVFEALTGYMPSTFDTFLTFDAATGRLVPLSDGPGEQGAPVVLSTKDGGFAMGIYAMPAEGTRGGVPRYGRWRFSDARVVKWNAVYRVRAADGVKPGDYVYQLYVPIGTREMCRTALVRLHELFGGTR